VWPHVKTHDLALFLLGACLAIWDIMISTPGEVSEPLLVFYAALLGLPFVMHRDRKRNGEA
jgi:hypothetical protein